MVNAEANSQHLRPSTFLLSGFSKRFLIFGATSLFILALDLRCLAVTFVPPRRCIAASPLVTPPLMQVHAAAFLHKVLGILKLSNIDAGTIHDRRPKTG